MKGTVYSILFLIDIHHNNANADNIILHYSIERMDSMGNDSSLILKICSQCASVLFKIKPAATLTLTISESKLLRECISGIDISFYPLSYKWDSITWFIYKEEVLIKTLNKADVRYILEKLGYQTQELTHCFNCLRKRFNNFHREKQDFPHELGLFLDYPTEDVIGFVMNKGKGCRYCGYWKVYSDVEEAKKTFYRYDLAKNTLLNEVYQGKTIGQAIASLVL